MADNAGHFCPRAGRLRQIDPRQPLLDEPEAKPERALAVLLGMLEGDPHAADENPLLLVLDDLHQVDSPTLAPLMTLLLERRPARLHLMLLGRQPTYGPLTRLYAAEQVLEVSKVELRFQPQEIGAITPQGRLFLTVYEHSITSQEVVAFLGQLQRMISGLLLVIWDGIPTHRSKRIRAYLAVGAAKRIHLEQLPGYAPDLNPTEWVWSYLKVAELANTPCDYLSEVATLIDKAKRRMQRKPELIQAFIRDAGYEV